MSFLKIGHRGARGYEPENTIRSFEKALSLGVDAIEFDIRASKDGEIVVIHDATLDRTTNGVGFVRNHTLAELRELNVGQSERIPTLAEVLEKFGKRTIINIEIKETGLAKQVLDLVRKYELADSVIVSAFSKDDNYPRSSTWTDLFWLKTHEKKLKIGLAAYEKEWAERAVTFSGRDQMFPVDYLCFSAMAARWRLIQKAHEETDAKVLVWTVNNPFLACWFRMIGADGVFSDYPDRII